MIQMAHISSDTAEAVRGIEFAPDSYCNPVLDGMGRWVISLEEAEALGVECEVVEWIAPKSDKLNNVSNGINP